MRGFGAAGFILAGFSVPVAALGAAAESSEFAGSASSVSVTSSCHDGYRRAGSFYDYALGRSWMVLESCGHPEMPRWAIDPAASGDKSLEALLQRGQMSAVGSAGGTSLPASPTRISSSPSPFLERIASVPAQEARPVLAGSRVRLWKRDSRVKIELSGVALESGVEGAAVRVRVAGGGQILRGVVRGPGSVELGDGMGFDAAGSSIGEGR